MPPSDHAIRVMAWPAGRAEQVNPYSRLLTDALRHEGCSVDDFDVGRLLRERYDIVHVHWPEWVLESGRARRIVRLLFALAWARRRGATLVWTVHNLGHHEGHDHVSGRVGRAAFVRLVDAFVSLTDSGVTVARERFPGLRNAQAFVVPHGHYRDMYPPPVDRRDARERLGVAPEARVACFIGHLRPYKQVVQLIEAFRGLHGGDVRLMVGGRPVDVEYERAVADAAAGDDRIRLHLGKLPDSDVVTWLGAADLVVLPYSETFNSGAALLALSFDRPVLGPAQGAFADLASGLGAKWVQTFSGPLTSDVLAHALAAVPTDPARLDLERFSWPAIGHATVDAYRSAMRERHVRRGVLGAVRHRLRPSRRT